MQNETRILFNTFTSRVALLSAVAAATAMFVVAPAVAQTTEKRIQESAAFLQAINIMPVREQMGEKIGIGVSGTIAGRTDTSSTDRVAKDMASLTADGYACQKTDFDTAVPYARLDSWAHLPDFETKLRDAIITQQGLDRLMIGWNGTSIAAATNRAANPLLEDVNKGWLQKIRENAAAQTMSGTKIGTGLAGADYKNIDQAVIDSLDLLHPTLRNHPDLVVICASDLLSQKYVDLAGDNTQATEREALSRLMSNKRLGGKRVIEAPFFPSNAFLITTLENLSIYWQIGSRRRSIQDNAKRDRIEDFQSVNEDYVVEEYQACAFIEGILVPDAAGTAWV
jgi:P2 family phage major capsid protein